MMNIFSSFDQTNYSYSFLFFSTYFMFLFLNSPIFSFAFFIMKTLITNLYKFFSSLLPSGVSKFYSFFSIFMFVFMFTLNFSALYSYNFSITAQASVVVGIAFIIWLSSMSFLFKEKSDKLFSHFIPSGSPLPLSIFLFLIEIVSTLIRPITLSIRLVANIFTGHLIVSLLSVLTFSFVPAYIALIFILIVESAVAFLQAYIFTTLFVLYYSEI